MLPVQRVRSPEDSGQPPNGLSVVASEAREVNMPPGRVALAVISGHIRDEFSLSRRESNDVRLTDQVVGVLVVLSRGDIDADVM